MTYGGYLGIFILGMGIGYLWRSIYYLKADIELLKAQVHNIGLYFEAKLNRFPEEIDQ
jgi:hypothetical protein